jgi:ABC-type sugar transport system substrate-binding protein
MRVAVCVGVTALGVMGCGSSSSTSSAPAAAGNAAANASSSGAASGANGGKVYKIVFETAFVGNDSQPQAQNVVKYVAAHQAPYDKEVKFSVALAASASVPDQLSSFEGVLRTKPDGIIVFPFSNTALNGEIQQACAEGIKVVAEDLTATAPCVYNETYDTTGVGTDQAAFMCKVLNGHGSVLVDRGQPSGSVAQSEVAARLAYLKAHCPGVTVAGYFTGNYTPGVELTAVSSALAAHPGVNGILSDYSCSADLLAEKHAGLKPLPDACFAVNGNATACVAAHVNCLLYSDPTTEYAEAMREVLGLLHGQTYPHFSALKQATYIVTPIDFPHVLPVEPLKAGVNYYPSLSPHLVIPVGTKSFPITPAVAMGG